MATPAANSFSVGERLDIVVKRNETYRHGFKLEEKDTDPESVTYGQWIAINLTGASIVGGLKRDYDSPEFLKAWEVETRTDAAGTFIMKCDLGLSGGKLARAAWDVVVTLADGRKIRAGAGYADLSQGVAGVTP